MSTEAKAHGMPQVQTVTVPHKREYPQDVLAEVIATSLADGSENSLHLKFYKFVILQKLKPQAGLKRNLFCGEMLKDFCRYTYIYIY